MISFLLTRSDIVLIHVVSNLHLSDIFKFGFQLWFWKILTNYSIITCLDSTRNRSKWRKLRIWPDFPLRSVEWNFLDRFCNRILMQLCDPYLRKKSGSRYLVTTGKEDTTLIRLTVFSVYPSEQEKQQDSDSCCTCEKIQDDVIRVNCSSDRLTTSSYCKLTTLVSRTRETRKGQSQHTQNCLETSWIFFHTDLADVEVSTRTRAQKLGARKIYWAAFFDLCRRVMRGAVFFDCAS